MNINLKLKKLAFAAVWGASLIPVVLIGLYPVVIANALLIAIYAVENKIVERM